MAVPNFSFDFSAFNPMVQAMSAYLPRMLATKAREQEALSPLVPTAARLSLNRSLAEEDRAERESGARITGATMAQALQNRLADEEARHARFRAPEMTSDEFRRSYARQQSNKPLTFDAVPGMGRPDYAAEAELLRTGRAGGASYGGSSRDESSPERTAYESGAFAAQRCKNNPYDVGCPGNP